jgi:hypothetical protein
MKKITKVDALIEHRNNIYTRIIGLKIDEKFFNRKNLIAKENSHLKIEEKLSKIKNAITGNEEILAVIDEMIKEAK